ncbi:MaoC family dehydratase N-terminal domain-containing protein [Nocardioides sp. CER19]|uniref:FAS1-like dehydratase domain-containing protein n=1 Tax=Nocardioides sp. CER19 TaxID=3038538 RepID=UPI00244725FA|nr:MaoC family dehydratase N-terminal domain-containing protein [Nocardioides sp. CER19]MDH2414498.1 MaoC family dehydratase N-terminal domain-containing protein [Nocardioides sp. CER19]
MDSSIVGRQFPPVGPYLVSAEKVREFATAIGWEYDSVPPTFPIVLAGASMNAFLDELGLELSLIVHGEQRFAYERPLADGDELTSTLTVASLRQIGGNDIIGTSTTFTDASGDLVCTATATLVHRGAAA